MAATTSGTSTIAAMSTVTAAAAPVRPLRSRAARNSGHVAMVSTVAHASAGRKVASIQTATASRPSAVAMPAKRCALVCRTGGGGGSEIVSVMTRVRLSLRIVADFARRLFGIRWQVHGDRAFSKATRRDHVGVFEILSGSCRLYHHRSVAGGGPNA